MIKQERIKGKRVWVPRQGAGVGPSLSGDQAAMIATMVFSTTAAGGDLDGTYPNPTIADNAITASKLAISVAGAGLSGGGGSALAVNVDDSTIQIASDILRVKAGGITDSHLSTSGITAGTYTKITFNAQGRATVGALLLATDLPSHSHAGEDIVSGTVAAVRLGLMTGATALAGGASGAVPNSSAGDQGKFLRADATWSSAGASVTGTDNKYTIKSGSNLVTARLEDGNAAAQVYAPWVSGDTKTTLYSGASNASNNRIAGHFETWNNYAGKFTNTNSALATIYAENGSSGPVLEAVGSGGLKAEKLTITTSPTVGYPLLCTAVGGATGFGTLTLAGDVTGAHTGVTVVKLQGRTLASTAPSPNQVITWNGTQWQPGAPLLALPYADTYTGVGTGFQITASSSGIAIAGISTGTSRAGDFSISNAASAADALRATTNGSGNAITSLNTGTGRAGYFETNNASNAANGLEVKAAGSGNATWIDYTGGGTSTTTTRNIAVWLAGGVRKARLDNTGKFFLAVASQVGGQDVAELYDVVGDPSTYEPGDLLAMSSTARVVQKASYLHPERVIGVYATRPGFIMAPEDATDEELALMIPVAAIGQCPIKVIGTIPLYSELMVSSTDGVATVYSGTPPRGSSIGRAWEAYDSLSVGVIEATIQKQS